MGNDTFWAEKSKPGQRVLKEKKGESGGAVLYIGPETNVDWLVLPNRPELGEAAGHRVRVTNTDVSECLVCNEQAKYHTTGVGFIVIECEKCSQWYVCESKGGK